MAHRDFDAARAERTADLVSFKLGGERFEFDRQIPAEPMLAMARAARLQPNIASQNATPEEVAEAIAEAYALTADFIEGILVPDDVDRFRRALRVSRMRFEGPDGLLELVQWLVEETVGRPLVSASDSSPESSTSSEPSKASSSQPALPSPSEAVPS